MDTNDRQLVLGLAERLRQAQPVPKDPQVADLITRQIAGQADVLYLLVQAVLVQEDALRTAQARITELTERAAAPSEPAPAPAPGPTGGGFMSGMFGRGRDAGAAPAEAPQGRSGGGSFLKTAAAAAAGVAGGGLLLGGLTGAFSGHEASAEPHHGDAGHGGWGDPVGFAEEDQW